MTMQQLKIFIAVAECGKMNVAAKQLFLSQPSVSQAVQEIEKQYNIRLFDRLNQKLYLTETGADLLLAARHVVDAFDSLDATLKNAGTSEKIRLGASVSVGTCLLAPLVQAAEENGMELRVLVNNTALVESRLLDSRLDVGIVEGRVESAELVQIPLCEDELVLLVGRLHPLYGAQNVTLAELAGTGYIAREDGSATRNQYEQILAEKGITLCQKWNCTNTEAIKNAVEAGKALAILSRRMVEREVKTGDLYVLPVQGIRAIRNIKLIYHRNKYLSPALQNLIALAKETVK
ncbi:MAG: LysR family transcriptional regulator [Ruthenibacterium sp.]